MRRAFVIFSSTTSSSSYVCMIHSITASGKNHLTEICFKSFDAEDWDRIEGAAHPGASCSVLGAVPGGWGRHYTSLTTLLRRPLLPAAAHSDQSTGVNCCSIICALRTSVLAASNFVQNIQHLSTSVQTLHINVLDLALHSNALNQSLFSIGIENKNASYLLGEKNEILSDKNFIKVGLRTKS